CGRFSPRSCGVAVFSINLGEVYNLAAIMPSRFQITTCRIEYNSGARLADMNIVINGWAAYVHFHLVFFKWLEDFFLSGSCLIDGDRLDASPLSISHILL